MPTTVHVHARGTRAQQPLAADVSAGTLYFVTDEGKTERSNGTIWETYSGAGVAELTNLQLQIDELRRAIETRLRVR
jgi:hypothetical protein